VEDPGEPTEPQGEDDVGEGFMHYTCATLAHFVALLCRPAANSVPPNTAVVVVDSLTALLNEAFPKAPGGRREIKSGKGMNTTRHCRATDISLFLPLQTGQRAHLDI
jgi:hypothetical protein